MAKHTEYDTQDGSKKTGSDRSRRKAKRFVRIFLIITVIITALPYLIGLCYRGPRKLADVVAVMPGVPIFPLSEISPANRRVQRALTIPLLLMRLQGARHAEVAQLQAPADNYFIVDWYRRLAPTQGWEFIGQRPEGKTTRVLYLREHEGLQIIIGRTEGLFTPYQLTYLSGLVTKQREQLLNAMPDAARHVPAPLAGSTPKQERPPAPLIQTPPPPTVATPGTQTTPKPGSDTTTPSTTPTPILPPANLPPAPETKPKNTTHNQTQTGQQPNRPRRHRRTPRQLRQMPPRPSTVPSQPLLRTPYFPKATVIKDKPKNPIPMPEETPATNQVPGTPETPSTP